MKSTPVYSTADLTVLIGPHYISDIGRRRSLSSFVEQTRSAGFRHLRTVVRVSIPLLRDVAVMVYNLCDSH